MNLFTLPAGRAAKWIVFAVTFLGFSAFASLGGKFEDAQKNETSSFLPGSAESVKTLKAIERFPGGEVAPAVIVYERASGLTEGGKGRISEPVGERNAVRNPPIPRTPLGVEAHPPGFARNGRAAIVVQPVEPGEGQADRF